MPAKEKFPWAIIPYESESRKLASGVGFGSGLGTQNVDELVRRISLLACSGPLRSGENDICNEIGEIFRFRILFLLLPERCLYEDTLGFDKDIIRNHLRNLGVEIDENLVSGIKLLCCNFRNRLLQQKRKIGIDDVYVQNKDVYGRILDRQNGRCCFCGKHLTRGPEMHLDHILPWHLGNDPSDGGNWQFCCSVCNRGKGVNPFYSLDKTYVNWIDPGQNSRLSERVRFAALCRDRKCVDSGLTPSEGELTVEKVVESGCWVLDNVKTVALINPDTFLSE